MKNAIEVVIYASLLVVAYAILCNRALHIGRRFREKAIKAADVLVQNDQVPDSVKHKVELTLPMAMSSWAAWCFAAMVLPALVIGWVWGTPKLDDIPTDKDPYFDDWDDYIDCLLISILSNSPIAAALFVIQMVVVSFAVLPHVLIGRMFNKAAQQRQKHDGLDSNSGHATAHG